MSWFFKVLVVVIAFISVSVLGEYDKALPVSEMAFDSGESLDVDDPETKSELNLMELELFSKLLSPNDTTLQQGTKSLLAKYIIAQIINDKRKNGATSITNTTETPIRIFPAKTIATNPSKYPEAPPTPLPTIASPPTVSSSTEAPPTSASSTNDPPTSVNSTNDPRTPATVTTEPPHTTVTVIKQAPFGETESTSTTKAPRITPSPEHVLNQVDRIIGNVAQGNIIGIVDESLAIRAPAPVRSLVNGILKLVFCNPIDRLMNRCRASTISGTGNNDPQTAAAAVQTQKQQQVTQTQSRFPNIFGR